MAQEWEVEKERLKYEAPKYVRLLLTPAAGGESRIQLSPMPIPGIELDVQTAPVKPLQSSTVPLHSRVDAF